MAFHGGGIGPISAALHALARSAEVDIALHLDHVEELDLLHRAPDAGFSSAMFDASTLPYDENVAATRAAVEWARGAGIILEAELGHVGGKGGHDRQCALRRCPYGPGSGSRFRRAHGCRRAGCCGRQLTRKDIAVGSARPRPDRDVSGGRARPAGTAWIVGVSDDQLRRAIRAGMVKINVGTALDVAFTDAVRNALEDQSLIDPRKYLAPARDAIARVNAAVSTARSSGWVMSTKARA